MKSLKVTAPYACSMGIFSLLKLLGVVLAMWGVAQCAQAQTYTPAYQNRYASYSYSRNTPNYTSYNIPRTYQNNGHLGHHYYHEKRFYGNRIYQFHDTRYPYDYN
ncbi:MAG: hypothetical protein ACOY3I_03145 [Verrucomicrobiota bacterium]